jgi:hypothetical protein
MNSIYFPYTYISTPVAEAVSACFGRFTVYQPLPDKLPPSMQALMDEGIMDIRIPVAGGSKDLVSAARNYLDWANAHADSSGSNLAFLKTLQASKPLLDDTLSSQIVADVKKQINGNSGSQSSNPVLAARIFLYFAQRFDQQNQELDHALTEFSQKEQALIQDLKMEDDALAAEFNKEPARTTDGNTDYLITGRLEAWTRILLNDKGPAGLFVTHSTAVLEQLLDSAPMAQKILDLEAIPRLTPATMAPASWQEQLFSYITDIAENNWTPESEKKTKEFDVPVAENTVSLKFYLVPDQNARQFFCQVSGIKGSEHDHLSPIASARNTLIALVGP